MTYANGAHGKARAESVRREVDERWLAAAAWVMRSVPASEDRAQARRVYALAVQAKIDADDTLAETPPLPPTADIRNVIASRGLYLIADRRDAEVTMTFHKTPAEWNDYFKLEFPDLDGVGSLTLLRKEQGDIDLSRVDEF